MHIPGILSLLRVSKGLRIFVIGIAVGSSGGVALLEKVEDIRFFRGNAILHYCNLVSSRRVL